MLATSPATRPCSTATPPDSAVAAQLRDSPVHRRSPRSRTGPLPPPRPSAFHGHTQMLSAQVPLGDRRPTLNHARISTTVNVYTHPIPAWDRPAAETISRIIDNSDPAEQPRRAKGWTFESRRLGPARVLIAPSQDKPVTGRDPTGSPPPGPRGQVPSRRHLTQDRTQIDTWPTCGTHVS